MEKLFNDSCFECSKLVTKKYSTSFSIAVKMLSPSIRPAIYAIYGFVRFADEIVDTFHNHDKEILIEEFEKEYYKAVERKISLNPILQSFQAVVNQYNIEDELVQAFLKSMKLDLKKKDYNSQAEYKEYIYGSADVVGLMCLRVFLNGDEESYQKLKPSAMSLGSAFQKVNFLRDFKDDSQQLERSYFPDIESNKINSDTKKSIIEDIENDFKDAYQGIIQLPIESRFGVYTAYYYYYKLLLKIKKANTEQLMESRIRISNPSKVLLLGKSYIRYQLNLL